MWNVTSAAEAHARALAERERAVQEIGSLCGLPVDKTADACGRRWCTYFDQERNGCGLLCWHIPQRIGIEGLRWFVDQRRRVQPTERGDLDELALLRTSSL